MKISQLCGMIQDSVRSGRYRLETPTQEKVAGLLVVTNKSAHDDLETAGIEIETRVGDLFVLNNYAANIKHLPGVIELDVLDSFRMICRKLERTDSGIQIGN
ncbi:MAG TPA: hypothetical protein VJL54_01560 [Nitrososphaera sp.]|nr:hypothetical protein [Nitrososphaera sp.]